MDPIKQKQIQDLKSQIKALKAQGKSADSAKLTKLEAELTKLINPKGNEAGEMGLRLQRAQKASSDYCEYQAKQGRISNNPEKIDGCKKNTTESIMSCEDTYMNTLHESPEEAESTCIKDHAKINKPTKKMEDHASEYCEYTSEEEGKKKTPQELSQCTTKTAQGLADCEDGLMSDSKAEICTDVHAKILRPTKNEQSAAAEICEDITGHNAECPKNIAKEIARCRDIEVKIFKTPQDVAENKCTDESKQRVFKIKTLEDKLKKQLQELQQQQNEQEKSEDRIKRKRRSDPSYEEI